MSVKVLGIVLAGPLFLMWCLIWCFMGPPDNKI